MAGTTNASIVNRSDRDAGAGRGRGERVALAALALGIAGLGFATLRPFVVPFLWAALLAYLSWPVFRRLRSLLGRPNLSALAMICTAALILAAAGLVLSMVLKTQVLDNFKTLGVEPLTRVGGTLVDALGTLPWIGSSLAETVRAFLSHPERLAAPIGVWLREQAGEIAAVAGSAGRLLLKLGILLLVLFFLYRDGETWWRDARSALQRLLGARTGDYVTAVTATIDAVVYGLLLTAMAQGAAAGIGYWLVGAPAPIMLALVTAALAILPYGAVLVWGPASLWLVLTGNPWAALALAVWGTVIVGLVDNVARPLLISSFTRVHLLVATLGVIGGVTAFGLIGIFVGPVVLALLLSVWRGWLATAPGQDAGSVREPVPALLTAAPSERAPDC